MKKLTAEILGRMALDCTVGQATGQDWYFQRAHRVGQALLDKLVEVGELRTVGGGLYTGFEAGRFLLLKLPEATR